MKAEYVREMSYIIRRYILSGILYLYKKADDKNGGVVSLPKAVDLLDGSGNYVTGIDVEFQGSEVLLLFHQNNDHDDVEDPQYLDHLKVEELIEVLSELEQLTGMQYDQPLIL